MSLKQWTITRDGDAISLAWKGDAKEAWLCIQSDEHKDSPAHQGELWEEHAREARSRGAAVLSLGDMFDAMGGRYDKRADPTGVKPEHRTKYAYFNSIVEDVAGQLAPYAAQYAMLARGNHETSVLRHVEIDLTQMLAEKLASSGFVGVVNGYSGYVRISVAGASQVLWYSHGRRGSSPVTRGVINTNRRAVWLPTPDIIASGDSHDSWLMPISRERITEDNERQVYEQLHIQCPSYVRTKADLGYVAENEMPPRPVGCWWLRFSRGRNGELRREVRYAG